MSLALIAVILAIGAGGVIAVSTREAAAAVVGLAVCLVAASLAADPLPSAGILGVRVVAALLASALIRWAASERAGQPSPIGWPGEALLATAGAVAGLGIATTLAAVSTTFGGGGGGTDGPGVGLGVGTSNGLLLAAGTMLLVLGTAALLHSRPGLRRAIGLVLVTQAVLLLRVGLAGPATTLEEITRAALLVAAAASASALARATATTDSPESTE